MRRMARVAAIPMLVASFGVTNPRATNASLLPWPTDGIRIGALRTGQQALVVPNDAGGTYFFWRAPDYSLHAQLVGETGLVHAGWNAEGRYLSGFALHACAIADGHGGALVAGDNTDRVALMHVAATGDIGAWVSSGGYGAADGNSISGSTHHGALKGPEDHSPTLAPDGEGGCLLMWGVRSRYDDGEMAARFGPDLGPLWRRSLSYPFPSSPAAAAPGWSGRSFFTWSDRQKGVRIWSFDRTGGEDTTWVWEDHTLCAMPNLLSGPGIVQDGAGGYYVAWEDLRAGESHPSAQRVTAKGHPYWTRDGIRLSSFPSRAAAEYVGTYLQGVPVTQIVADGRGGAYVAWVDLRDSAVAGEDVYLQHLIGAGPDPAWPADGLAVAAAPGAQTRPRLAPDGSGGVFIAWQDARSGEEDVYAQRIESSGAVAAGWPGEGLAICTARGRQIRPAVAAEGNTAYVTWEDWRSDSAEVYAARIEDAPTPVAMALLSAEATPRSVRLTWTLGDRAGIAALSRRTEQSGWIALPIAPTLDQDRAMFVDETVHPGTRYAYRLEVSIGSETRRTPEIWVDVPATLELALQGFRPNPASSEIHVAFTLPDDRPATLELLDVSGRRVGEARAVRGAGSQLIRWPRGSEVGPGIYWVRLRQGSDARIARGCLAR